MIRKENTIKLQNPSLKKNQVVAPVFLQNENRNSDSSILSTNNKKINKPKISTENEYH